MRTVSAGVGILSHGAAGATLRDMMGSFVLCGTFPLWAEGLAGLQVVMLLVCAWDAQLRKRVVRPLFAPFPQGQRQDSLCWRVREAPRRTQKRLPYLCYKQARAVARVSTMHSSTPCSHGRVLRLLPECSCILMSSIFITRPQLEPYLNCKLSNEQAPTQNKCKHKLQYVRMKRYVQTCKWMRWDR